MKIDNRLSFERMGKELKHIPEWLKKQRQETTRVRKALKIHGNRLEDREIRVVKMKWGIDRLKRHSYKEIGEVLGLSRVRANQIGILAIFRLGLDGDK